MSNVVLKQFTVDESAETIVDIEGRNSGLIAWFLNLVGIDDTIALRCTRTSIEYRSSSFFGASSMLIPLSAVSGIVSGLRKPKEWLYLALGIGGCGIAGSASLAGSGAGSALTGVVFSLVLAAACLLVYSIKKRMSLFVQNGGDLLYGLEFQKSIIEGVEVDSAKVGRAIEAINRAVLSKHAGRRGRPGGLLRAGGPRRRRGTPAAPAHPWRNLTESVRT